MAEQPAGQAVIGIAEVRVIKNIEKLRAETKVNVFRDTKLTLHREIRLQTERLEVSLSYGRDLTLCVSDIGIGIDQVVADKGREGHFGLHGMRERAARIGGKLTMVSSLGLRNKD